MAKPYDMPVIPHGSGPYSYHFVASQPNAPFCEYVAASPDGVFVTGVTSIPAGGDSFSAGYGTVAYKS